MKILFWDRDGYALWYKRLEAGVSHFPRCGDGRAELTAAELAMVHEGIELRDVERRKRYRRGAKDNAA